MKRVFLFFILTFIAASIALPQANDIRKLKWGMSFEDVQRIEELGDNFFKVEGLLGIQVETRFGFDYKGLYSVTYSTREKEFAVKAGERLRAKYGEPKTGLDYSFMMQSKIILNSHPEAVIKAYETGDFSTLEKINNRDERKLIRNILAKQEMWEYGNTVALLLNSPDVAKLSYWAKAHHNKSKKKFAQLVVELKNKIKKAAAKKDDDSDKF
ncbi:MAG: hypothetical protein GY940_25845 [bacterium]|nr:hypothetical protein [bacterium]